MPAKSMRLCFLQLALNRSQYNEAKIIAFQNRSILICGLRQAGVTSKDWNANLSILQATGAFRGPGPTKYFNDPLLSNLRFAQTKHHRWYRDRAQIVNDQLAGHFPALHGCWEHIELLPRT
jgi:hypothetical protein